MKNSGSVCERCGASIGDPSAERLVLTSGGYTLYSDNGKNNNRFSSCKISMTDKRLVIYKIKPEANSQAFGLFKDLLNAIKKNPFISIILDDIEYIRRYDTKFLIQTKADAYYVWLVKHKEFDDLFASYKQSDD